MTERKPSNAPIPKFIKADVLDKIRTEVEQKIKKRPGLNHTRAERERNDAFLEVLDIIDKYKAEVEPQESEET